MINSESEVRSVSRRHVYLPASAPASPAECSDVSPLPRLGRSVGERVGRAARRTALLLEVWSVNVAALLLSPLRFSCPEKTDELLV